MPSCNYLHLFVINWFSVQDEELKLLKEEVQGRPLKISFDETTIRSVVLCVIVGFVDDKSQMQQRVIKLGLYNESPEEKLTNQMSDHILTANPLGSSTSPQSSH